MGTEVIERLASSPVEYRGQRVITLAMMDEAHDRREGTAKRAFHSHKDKLVEGEDFHRVPRAELSTLNVLSSKHMAEDPVFLTEIRDPQYHGSLTFGVKRRPSAMRRAGVNP